jgi:hypothetical protein
VDPARSPRSFEEGLHLLFDLDPFVGAIAVSSVERLFLSSEVETLDAPRDSDGSRRVRVERVEYAGWDLNRVLGVPAEPSAWFIVRWVGGISATRALVGVGTCLAIRPIPPPTALPPSVFTTRRGAIAGCFPTRDFGGRVAERVAGLVIDVPHLWSKAELRAAERMLEAGGPLP